MYWKPFFNKIPCTKHYWSELKCKVDLSWPGIKNTRFKVWNKRKCLKDADSFALQLLHFTFYGRDNFACYVGQSLWLVGYSFFARFSILSPVGILYGGLRNPLFIPIRPYYPVMYSDKVSFIANSDLFIRLNKASNMAGTSNILSNRGHG